jgi:hypothetical protein
MTAVELAEIRRRANSASPGQWVAEDVADGEGDILARRIEGICAAFTHDHDADQQAADFAFIAHARQDIPRLLDEIERLRRLLANETFSTAS